MKYKIASKPHSENKLLELRSKISMLIGSALFLAGLYGVWLSIKRDIYFGALPFGSAFVFAACVIVVLSEIADRRLKMLTDRRDAPR